MIGLSALALVILAGCLPESGQRKSSALAETPRRPEALVAECALCHSTIEAQRGIARTFEEHQHAEAAKRILEMAEGKTGSLFSCAMKLGALVAGAGEAAIESVGVCGAKLGVALQVLNYLLQAPFKISRVDVMNVEVSLFPPNNIDRYKFHVNVTIIINFIDGDDVHSSCPRFVRVSSLRIA